jgi:hypothetical protein
MQFVVVPKPAGWMLLAGAAVAIGAAARRRHKCRAGISPHASDLIAGDSGDP